MSPRQRKLWLWSAAITMGTVAAFYGVHALERSRDPNTLDPQSGVSRQFRDAGRAANSPVRFADVTAAAGLRMPTLEPPRRRTIVEDNGSGLAWGDFDGDGWPDLYVVRHTGGNRLFRNNGDGTFTDVTDHAGVSHPGDWGMGATWVDFDDDGRLDLYVTNRGPNRLYRNLGDGTFVDVAPHAGVADPLWGNGAAWGDFDRDGHIDFYLCNYLTYDSEGREPPANAVSAGTYEAPFTLNPSSYDPQPNRLFRNRGDGTFEDVTERAGVADPEGRSMGATFCDLDGDGWLDLYVNNDVSRDRLFRNLGGARPPGATPKFVDVSALAGTADPRGAMGLSVAEVGDLVDAADALPDLFITHWVAEGNALYISRRTPDGTLEYRDEARSVWLAEISLDEVGWGCGFADFDLDGKVDIAVANGSTLEQERNPMLLRPERMFIFMNNGMGFRDVAPVAGTVTQRAYNARGLAIADYDGDGRPDIALMTMEGLPVLLRNETSTVHHGLTVRLRGTAAQSFGARVEVWTGNQHQVRWAGSDVSYLSQHASTLIFGLGDAEGADRVRVQWADGSITALEHVRAGTVIVEHHG